jgi:hypothetical protein
MAGCFRVMSGRRNEKMWFGQIEIAGAPQVCGDLSHAPPFNLSNGALNWRTPEAGSFLAALNARW